MERFHYFMAIAHKYIRLKLGGAQRENGEEARQRGLGQRTATEHVQTATTTCILRRTYSRSDDVWRRRQLTVRPSLRQYPLSREHNTPEEEETIKPCAYTSSSRQKTKSGPSLQHEYLPIPRLRTYRHATATTTPVAVVAAGTASGRRGRSMAGRDAGTSCTRERTPSTSMSPRTLAAGTSNMEQHS